MRLIDNHNYVHYLLSFPLMIVIRYLRDAACGTLFPEKMKLDLNGLAKGATEMTVRLLEHNNEANETSSWLDWRER